MKTWFKASLLVFGAWTVFYTLLWLGGQMPDTHPFVTITLSPFYIWGNLTPHPFFLLFGWFVSAIGILLALREHRAARFALVGLLAIHYLGVAYSLHECKWESAVRAWRGTPEILLSFLTLYVGSQVAIWFLVLKRRPCLPVQVQGTTTEMSNSLLFLFVNMSFILQWCLCTLIPYWIFPRDSGIGDPNANPLAQFVYSRLCEILPSSIRGDAPLAVVTLMNGALYGAVLGGCVVFIRRFCRRRH